MIPLYSDFTKISETGIRLMHIVDGTKLVRSLASLRRRLFTLPSRAEDIPFGWDYARKGQLFSYSKVAFSGDDDDAHPNGGGSSPEVKAQGSKSRQWYTLPPFESSVDAGALGKKLMGTAPATSPASAMTAIKWVGRCCPDLPRTLVQKLFRLRKVRMECLNPLDPTSMIKQENQKLQLKRVSAKEIIKLGAKIYLPMISYRCKVAKKYDPVSRGTLNQNVDEMKYIRSLELYKDPAIIVLNKPPGLPVQGGVGVHKSMDALAAAALSYEYTEGPRLVHRLDKESSGILVMGRTHESVALLHSLFREKTVAASSSMDGANYERTLERRYWALVIGTPKKKQGQISAPLTKVVLDDGRSERILVADDSKMGSAQDAITEYRVLRPSVNGCTWLELCPLTGRKHQLRVHCAEALGTPIVGDYKYGRHVHRRWKHMPQVDMDPEIIPDGLNVEKGSVLAKVPLLHLHCRELTIPNVARALEQSHNADLGDSKLDILQFVAPLPLHMAISWNIVSSSVV